MDYVNIWKMSEAANLVFQWIFVLNSNEVSIFIFKFEKNNQLGSKYTQNM